VDRALEKDPADRYGAAGEFSEALESLVGPDVGEAGAAGRQMPLWRRMIVPGAALVVIAAVLIWGVTRGPTVKGDRSAAERHNIQGQQYQDEGDIAGAQLEYQNAIIADPTWEIPWNNLALIALDRQNFDEADSLLGEALTRSPDYAQALYNMGNVRWEKNDLESAEGNLLAAIEADPSFIPAYNNLGRLLIDSGRPSEAADILDRALAGFDGTSYPDEFKAFLLKNRGIAAAKLGDERAETFWRNSLEIDPDNEEVRSLLDNWLSPK
jgi:Tfp pilus assembly protein PilF